MPKSCAVYVTLVDNAKVYEGTDLEAAVSKWDSETFLLGRSVSGGISVQEFAANGIMVRDGWILHVHNDGTVFLNPAMK